MAELSDHQKEAFNTLLGAIANPDVKFTVLEGFSGTGKTFMVRKLVDELPKYLDAMRLVSPKTPHYGIRLTATTNKAAEALETLSSMDVTTIHSALSLRVIRDYKTGITSLSQSKKFEKLRDTILFVDEISFGDEQLLGFIEGSLGNNCKVIYIGDPAQLVGFDSDSAPAFSKGYLTAKLTETMRQGEGNQIIDVGAMLRDGVTTGVLKPFTPDGTNIRHLSQEEFEKEILADMGSPDWKANDSKILAWRNATVQRYNDMVTMHIHGSPGLVEGDYAICNSFVKAGKYSIKTDQVVQIARIEPATKHGVLGKEYTLTNGGILFCPDNVKDKKKTSKKLRDQGEYTEAFIVDDSWGDLRPAYASTVDKSQGSTYKRAYVDLNDIGASRYRWHTMFRLLYVAFTRPSHELILVGDLG